MPTISHLVRPSLITSQTVFSLDNDGLKIEAGEKTSTLAYADIACLELISYAGAGGSQGRLTVRSKTGEKTIVTSHHYKSLGLFENRSQTYEPFVRQLAKQVEHANPAATMQAGSALLRTAWLIVIGLLIITAVILAITLFYERETSFGVFAGLVGIVAALGFSWRNVKINRRSTFDPNDPPQKLLTF